MKDIDGISRYVDSLVYILSQIFVCTQWMYFHIYLHMVSMSLFIIITHVMLPLLMHSPSPLPLHQFIPFLLSVIPH